MAPTSVVTGQIALITGAARGIGRATARTLLSRGCVVALVDRDDPSRTATELSACGTAHAYTLDVSDADAFEQLVASIEDELGPIDILVNNAGIMRIGPFLDTDAAHTDAQLAVNLQGVMNGMRAVLPRMRARGRGTVVNIASTAGKLGTPYGAVYSASKHAVVGLTESVRIELEGTGVHLAYVCPAPVKTELITGVQHLRWPPPCEVQDVADGVLEAIERGKVDVFVPKSARLAVILPALLPRRVYEKIGRLLGVDRIFKAADHSARASYEHRHSPEPSET
ncbi:MAG: SDR family oxidoreductase [Proteobacteria bacterium]|nr:SDR family oxidoreductase [Pseudomonadota bacterium]